MSKPMSIDPTMVIYTANAEDDHKRLTELCRKLCDAGDVRGLSDLSELMQKQAGNTPHLYSVARLMQMPSFYMETALNNVIKQVDSQSASPSANTNTTKSKATGKTYLIPSRMVPKRRFK